MRKLSDKLNYKKLRLYRILRKVNKVNYKLLLLIY